MKRTPLFLLIALSLSVITIGSAPSLFTAIGVSAQTTKPAEVKIDPKVFDEFIGQYSLDTNPDVVLSFFREGEKY